MFDINKCPKDKDGNLLAQTLEGLPVVLISTNCRGKQPLAGYAGDSDALHQWCLNGYFQREFSPHIYNLINIPESKRSGEVWVNIYRDDAPIAQELRAGADRITMGSSPRIACVRVPWTEGDGLEGK